jgi:hypothetical protein
LSKKALVIKKQKSTKKSHCYKRYKNIMTKMDEKAKCQPLVIRILMKEPKFDENNILKRWKIILHSKYG